MHAVMYVLNSLLSFTMQEVRDFSKIATTRKQSFVQCEAAVADLHDRLRQSQQLTDACGCPDGSAAVKLCSLRDQLEAARCLQLACLFLFCPYMSQALITGRCFCDVHMICENLQLMHWMLSKLDV